MFIRRIAPLAPLLVCLYVLLIAFVVRVLDLSAQSLWYDEGYTVMFAQRTIGDIVTGAAQLELNTPLHYLALKVWMAGVGTSEFATRLLSAFAGVLTVAMACALTKIVLKRASGLPMLLVALSPVCVLMSREVRMYALAACLCLASVVACAVCMRRGKASMWAIWALVSLAAFGTHVLSAFVVGAQVLVIGFGWARQRRIAHVPFGAVAFVLSGIAILAALVLLSSNAYGTTFRDRLDVFGTLANSIASQLLPRLMPETLIGVAAAMGSVAIVLAGLVVQRRNALASQVWFVTVVGIVFIAMFAVVTGKFSSRYPAMVAPIFLTAIGLGIVVPTNVVDARNGAGIQNIRSVLSHGIAGVFTLASLFGLWNVYTNRIYDNENFRDATTFIKANAQPDEAVLLVSGHFAPVFAYYFGEQGWTALPNDPVLNVNNALTWESTMPAMNAALAGKGGAWLLAWQDDLADPTGLVPALLRRQSQALVPALDTAEFRGLRVQRYRFFQPFQPLPVRLPQFTSQIEPVGQSVGLGALGCHQPNLPRAGDSWMEIHCFWQVQPFVQLSGFTKVSLRLFDARGKQVLQVDQPIAPNGMPYFPYEKPILGLYFIELPPDILPGEYTLRAIPYAEQGELAPQLVTQVRVLPK